MKVNEVLHGFKLLYTQELPEIKATLYRMEYLKNGADLCWLDRKDDNMSFCIGFKTIPQDDTGVFHIIEHSVLCGSDKYPVREPFVELLKSSLQTFLNAMTYPDKTVYPVASRNKQDFLNLIDVYMDAVLHPISIKDPNAFRQEGWHYEPGKEDGTLIFNGVVFNEMKGALADPDDMLSTEMNRLLFPDNCYGYCSGGDPVSIPNLTYEGYLASHARFYHPSNSRIFLDGSIDLDTVLAKLDSFLKDYDRIDPDAEIPMQKPVHPAEKVLSYEVSSDDAGAAKAILARGWVFGTFDEKVKGLAGSALTEMLCGSNEAPLTKALLDAGLCEDVEFGQMDGIQQLYTVLILRNADPARREEAWKLVEDTLRSLAKNGLDHKRLHAILNRMEFSTREMDFGSFPKGLVLALNSYDTWLYGGDPALNFAFDQGFKAVRDMIDNGGFEKLIEDCFLSNDHTATMCLLPSTTLGEEKAAREAERLKAERAAMSDADVERIMKEFEALRAHQATPDTEEQLATMPQLSLKDLDTKVVPMEVKEERAGDMKVLRYEADTNGIRYANLYFDIGDIPAEEMPKVSLLCSLLTQVATEKFSALELSNEINANLGACVVVPTYFGSPDIPTDCRPYVYMNLACLETYQESAVSLADQILNHSLFTDRNAIFNMIRQERITREQSIGDRGDRVAANRAMAGLDVRSAMDERLNGIEKLRYLQAVEKSFDAEGEKLCSELAALAKKIFCRARLFAEVTGDAPAAWLEEFYKLLPQGSIGEKVSYQPLTGRDEGFMIPAEVGYSGKAAILPGFTGACLVAAQYLSLDYLWNNVRVQGGAYGAGGRMNYDRSLKFTSYRDPQCANSLKVFDGCPEILRATAKSGEDLERFIISLMGSLDPLMTPRTAGNRALTYHMNGVTTEERQSNRNEVLATQASDFMKVADLMEEALKSANTCVIGGKASLDACGSALKTVESVAK